MKRFCVFSGEISEECNTIEEAVKVAFSIAANGLDFAISDKQFGMTLTSQELLRGDSVKFISVPEIFTMEEKQ